MLQCAVEGTGQQTRPRYAVGRADITPPPKRAPALLLQGVGRTVAAGGTIYAQANSADFIYQVTSGMVRTITMRRDGRRVVHGFHLAGEIFGLERETLHHCSAEAVCETRLVLCPRCRLEDRVSSDDDTARELWSSLLLSRDKTAERFLYLMHGSAVEKLAYFLIDLAWRTRQGQFDLDMSRYDIADYLGLSSETVSRTFSVFRKRGLIATRGRQVTLLDNRLLRMGEHWTDEDEAHHDRRSWPRTYP
jgi:CRP-like cAMP-binding protein